MAFQDDLLELAALDRRVIQTVMESDWDGLKAALTEYEALRRRIRTQLLEQPVVSVGDADAAALLQKITTKGDDLPTDKLIKHLQALSDSGENIEEFGYDELEELGSDLFYSWFSHHEYILGLAELRPLVVSNSVGEVVSTLVRQIKDCYAFQQYDAACVLCRTLIEASIRDICIRRRLFPDVGENVTLFEKFSWGHLRDKVSSGPIREKLTSLYSDLSAVLHGRKYVSKDEVRRAFQDTLQVIEHLYAAHGL